MNNYRKSMKNLNFDPDFSEKTIRLLNSYTDTVVSETKQSPVRKYGRILLVAAALTAVLTPVAFAAVQLLTPSQVANHFDDEKLADAFESDKALIVNEEKTVGEYTITLSGVVSGVDVADILGEEDAVSDYVVVAVRYTDGRAIVQDETWESDPIFRFTVSPYVHGRTPSEVNLFSLESRASKCVVGNVLYILLETDKLEAFYDTTLYLGVVESDTMAHIVNDERCPFALADNGEIVMKEQWNEDAACVLFELPM